MVSSFRKIFRFKYSKPMLDPEDVMEDFSLDDLQMPKINKFKLGMALASTALGVGPSIEDLLNDPDNMERLESMVQGLDLSLVFAKELIDDDVVETVWEEQVVNDEEVCYIIRI
jgi:hypothetical protein